MLSTINAYLKAKLEPLTYIDMVYGLGEVVSEGGKKYPVVYEKNEALPVNFDAYQCLAFFIRDGKVDRNQEEHEFLGGEYVITEIYPYKLIIYVHGIENVNCDNLSGQITWAIAQILTGAQPTLESEVGFEGAEITITAIETNKNTVWADIYGGQSKLRDSDILLSVSFEVETTGVQTCYLTPPCNSSDFDFSGNYTSLCEKINDCLFTAGGVFLIEYLTDGSSTYQNDLLINAAVKEISVDGKILNRLVTPADWSFNSTTGTISFNITVYNGSEIHIRYNK